MKRLVDLVKLDRLDNLIRRAATGSPENLAERLEMSRSSLFELIAFLRVEMRAPIIYNKNRLSYMYSYNPRFYLGFERDQINTFEMFNADSSVLINEKSNNKIKVEIEIDDDVFILDNDIDFTDLYN